MKPLIDIKNLYPILQSNAFPFLEKTYDDISEYSILARLQKAINDVIDNNNALNDNFTELNNNFVNLTEYVNNYFKNLDVQDEIDNKLQQMAESGDLENILLSFFMMNPFLIFKNNSELSNNVNLKKGNIVKTLGFYSENDDGGNIFIISDIQDDTILSLTLQNDLYANIVVENGKLCPEQLGAKGDGINDDTIYINKILNNKNIQINFIQNKIYGISSQLFIDDSRYYDFNGTTIKALSENAKIFVNGTPNDNPIIDNLVFDGNYTAKICIEVTGCKYLLLNSPKIYNFTQYGIYVYKNTETGNGSIIANNINIFNKINTKLNYALCKDAIALYINNTDSKINGGTTTNFITHILCSNDTLIENIHAWNYYQPDYDLTLNSCFVRTNSSIRMINCFVDSIMTMLDMKNADSIYTASFIDDSVFFYNVKQITDLSYTPKPLIKNENCYLYCYNSKFNVSFNRDQTAVDICNTNINFWSNGIYTIKTNLKTTNIKSTAIVIRPNESYKFEPFTNFALIMGGVRGTENEMYMGYVGRINPVTSIQTIQDSEKYTVSCDESRCITVSSTCEQATIFTLIHD